MLPNSPQSPSSSRFVRARSAIARRRQHITARLALAVVTSVAASGDAGVLHAQTAKPTVGLLVVAHGADSTWNANVRRTVQQVQWSGPVEVAFLMGPEAHHASWNVAVRALEAKKASRIVAVPLMVSTHGSHVDQIRFYAGELPALPPELASMGGHDHEAPVKATVPVRTTQALDDAAELGQALFERWQALSAADKARPLVLVAHGPTDNAQAVLWEKNIAAATSRIAGLVAPRPTRIHLLRDDAPAAVRAAAVQEMRDTISALAARVRDSVTVLPVLISTGAVNTVKIPADIKGLPVRYQPVGLTPSAALARWIERVAAASIAK